MVEISKLFVKKDILNNPSISNEGLLAYLALTYQLQKSKTLFTSIDILCCILQGFSEEYTNNRTLYSKIKLGLENLEENNLIKVLFQIKKQDLALDCSKLFLNPEENSFIIVDFKLVQDIILTPNIAVDKAIRFLLVLTASINTETQVGFTSIEKLAQKSRISKNQAIGLIKKLENHNVLYVHRTDQSKRLDNGQIVNRPNQYVLFS